MSLLPKPFAPYRGFIGISCLMFLASCGQPEEKTANGKKAADSVANVEETSAPGENENMATEGDYYFSGLIDHKYSIYVHLSVSNGAATGTYYYNSQKRKLGLDGTAGNQQLELDERVKEKVTGHFSGTLYGADSASGTWKSPKGKELVFVLYGSSQEKYEKELKGEKVERFDPAALKAFARKFKTVQLPFECEAMDEEEGADLGFSDEEIRKYVMPEYDPESDFGYHYYYGYTFQTDAYLALVFTEDYYPGAFGIHNQSLVMMTFSLNGDLISRAYLGCDCMDTNMGANDYYATEDEFFFTAGNIRVESELTHATLIEVEGETPETPPFEEKSKETRNITIGADGKVGKTGY